MIVYMITNNINNKKYIGITSKKIEERFEMHRKNARKKINRYLYDAMNKYGLENFSISIIDDSASNWEDLQKKEIIYIKEYNTLSPDGYNMTSGGDGGYTIKAWPEEKRKALYKQQGKSRIGWVMGEEAREKISKASSYRMNNMSDAERKEFGAKISATLKAIGRRPPVHHRGNPGYKHTEEDKRRISLARSGKTYKEIFDPATELKLKEMHREHWTGKGNPNHKEIDSTTKIKFIDLIMIQGLTLLDACSNAELSIYSGRKIIRDLGIKNYQRWKMCLSTDEVLIFAKEVLYALKGN